MSVGLVVGRQQKWAFFNCRKSPVTTYRLLLARLPATAGIVTEVPKGRGFSASVCSDLFFEIILRQLRILENLKKKSDSNGLTCMHWKME